MRINCYNTFPNTSFQSKKKDIKKADDIQRAAVSEFPMISSSKIIRTYPSYNKHSKYSEVVREFANDIRNDIENMRFLDRMYSKGFASVPFESTLEMIKRGRKGNCSESAVAALSTLWANGYKDSYRARLFYDVTIIKKPKNEGEKPEVVWHKKDDLDHEFVITSMGKNSDKEKDKIIVDAWSGFADSYSNARGRYNQMYYDKMYCSRRDNLSLLRVDCYQKDGHFNPDDYEVKGSLVLEKYSDFDDKTKQLAGKFFAEKYKNLVIDK